MKKLAMLVITLSFGLAVTSCQKENLDTLAVSQSSTAESEVNIDLPATETEGMERNTGCKMLPDALYNKLSKDDDALSIQAMPSSVSLSCPSVRNQGSEGSCVSFAVAYAARSILKKYKTGASYSINTNTFSPEFVHNQIKLSNDCEDGTYIVDAMALLMGGGVCTWSAMPYSSSNGCSQLPSNSAVTSAFGNKITSFSSTTPSVSNIKSKLASNKPVIVAGPVDANFDNLGNNQVLSQYNSGTFRGDHAYCVVGYSDTKKAFKVMNSWGTTWGTSGFGWISYDLISPPYNLSHIPLNIVWKQAYVMSSIF